MCFDVRRTLRSPTEKHSPIVKLIKNLIFYMGVLKYDFDIFKRVLWDQLIDHIAVAYFCRSHTLRPYDAFTKNLSRWNPRVAYVYEYEIFSFSLPSSFRITCNVASRRREKCFLCTEFELVPRGMLRAWHNRTYEITFWSPGLSLPFPFLPCYPSMHPNTLKELNSFLGQDGKCV